MQVILRADVPDLGTTGDLVDVSDGYARNYLVPKGLAMRATEGAVKQAQSMRKARDVRDAKVRAEAEQVASRLVPQVIKIPARAGQGDKLFGSITSVDIASAVQAQADIEIDRKQIDLDQPIKTLGMHTVSAKLHPEVQFPVTVEVDVP